MRDSILVRNDTCFACPIRCKRVVEVQGEYKVDPIYGGPEYETLAAFGSNCLAFEEADYCNLGNARLRFYVNGKPNDEFDNYVIKDLDKILVSYGSESDEEIKKQLDSVTNLAAKYSANKYS